ncbi:inositol 1,4,5-triphosphate receptor associated 2 isoform X3 [Latimeria chalumnae]|uniref:inositol 1,4,5-triphosphate receptor associated 2 isoform X3 n=1 Tax=Latimeria chalumnae TaxID=7897 RepID=UPI0006D9157B|nr:PREDICTED: lymphoid-restricted membrane protein-like [Latimeria chalumnae]|eukprot:XP_014352241.1 PREDICTED: lymphoid-restricted membrane protein-like [Latimeria chalumnae]
MGSKQKIPVPLQRSFSLSSFFSLPSQEADDPWQLWEQKNVQESLNKLPGWEPGHGGREDFDVLSKDQLKQQQCEMETLISSVTAGEEEDSQEEAMSHLEMREEGCQMYNEEFTPRSSSRELSRSTENSDNSDDDNCSQDPLATSCEELSILERLGLHRVNLTETEVEQLKSTCLDPKRRDILQQLEQGLKVLSNSIERVACTAEMLGAVHQEARVSRAIEVMIQHVDNLKRRHSREHAELEEMKRLIQQNSRNRQLAEIRDDGEFCSRYPLMRSVHQPSSRRRVSIAVIPKQLNFQGPDWKGLDNGKIRSEPDTWRVNGENKQPGKRRSFCQQEDSLEDNLHRQPDPCGKILLTSDSSEFDGDSVFSLGNEPIQIRKRSRDTGTSTLTPEPPLEQDSREESSESEEMVTLCSSRKCSVSRQLQEGVLLSHLSRHRWFLLWLVLMLVACLLLAGLLSHRTRSTSSEP